MDIPAYRLRAEAFTAAISKEHYLHFAGLKEGFEIEAIYDEYPDLFTPAAVEQFHELVASATPGDELRSRRALLDFAVEGYIGQATKRQAAELARREADLKIAVDGEEIGYRESAVVQANEPDRERREAIEVARLEAVEQSLNPLLSEALTQTHELARELGWGSYVEMCEQLSGIDLTALELRVSEFMRKTDELYPTALESELERVVGVGLDGVRRSDLPWLFRATDADRLFPEERLVESFRETIAGLGIDLDAQANVHLDVERRAQKSPRAFCAPVRVPEEVYLVVPPIGGRDDYRALFHEGGHTEHFAFVDPKLPFEFRQLGDNSVTEGFAFLFHYLTENPEWLRRRLGIEDDVGLAAHARAQQLYFLRRYGAKLAYELELHTGGGDHDTLADRYAELLAGATLVPWPRQMFLSDVDPGFYAANYLRAWALESALSTTLRERFGEAWFEQREAGDFLKDLWREGQRLNADKLIAEIGGGELDWTPLLEKLALRTTAVTDHPDVHGARLS